MTGASALGRTHALSCAGRSHGTSRPYRASRSHRASRLHRDEDGSASVEFVYLALLLMVPLVYLIIAAFQVQRSAFAVAEAARQAGRAYVTSVGDDEGGERALFVANLALADQGLAALEAAGLGIDAPSGFCGGGLVTVTVRREVDVPLLGRLTHLSVSGEHTEAIDPYRTVEPCTP